MIGLGAIEGLVGLDLRGDRLCEITPLADLREIGGRDAALHRVERHDRGTILRSDVGALPVLQRRIGDDRKEDAQQRTIADDARIIGDAHRFGVRSEEHTSELQSLMRISYAVFCLKKTKLNTTSN